MLVFPRVEKNGLHVALARSLGNAGFNVFRYDMRGSGESTGTEPELNFGRLHTDDVMAVVAELRRRGMDRVVLIGKCFGARTVLAAAGQLAGLKGVALISTNLLPPGMGTYDRNYFLPNPGMLVGLFDGRRRHAVLRALWAWARSTGRRMRWPFPGLHPVLLMHVRNAIRARVPLLFLYGTDDRFYVKFSRAMRGPLGKLLERGGDRAQVQVLEGGVYDPTTLAVQQRIVACLRSWVEHVMPADSED
ncbi:MAG TPA: alpha/beta fold hydrolase [bacterium]|nr:alpha/beta fold hydrolase [bacterium]